MQSLEHPDINKLIILLKEIPRAAKKGENTYIDTGDNSQLISIARHGAIFGRRGSGKTMLLRELRKKCIESGDRVIWIDIDIYKELIFPDILIQILRSIFEELQNDVRSKSWFRNRELRRQIADELKYLRERLEEFEESSVTLESTKSRKSVEEKTNEFGGSNSGFGAKQQNKRSHDEADIASKSTAAGEFKIINAYPCN